MCVPAAGGWAAFSLGSEGAASCALAAASLETVSFGLDKGIGDGRKCLGNPLKNQAPDLFHTWGTIGLFNAQTYILQLILVSFTDFKHLPLAALCRSCIATRRVADCRTGSHTWCTCSAKREERGTRDLWIFFYLYLTSADKCIQLTFLQSSHTTDLTPGDPSCSPHSRQRDIPSPHTVFFISSRRFIKRLQQHREWGQDTTLNATANHPAATSVRWCQGKWLQISQISHPILSCSIASIFSARAITLFIISFSSSVRSGPGPGPGCMVQVPLSAKQ